MNAILKSARVQKQALDEGELTLINRQALRTLAAEEVFVFRMAACDDQVDRDNERFTAAALEELAEEGRFAEKDAKLAALELPYGAEAPGWRLVHTGQRTGWVDRDFIEAAPTGGSEEE